MVINGWGILQSARAIIAYHYKNGINIHDLFLFDVALEGLGKWYRQLMGESIGKELIYMARK